MHGNTNRKPGHSRRFSRLGLTTTATATVLLLAGCGGGGGDSELPITSQIAVPPEFAAAQAGELSASTDIKEIVAGQATTISLLSNDTFADQETELQLLGSPEFGTVELLDNGEISYTANEDFEGTDKITYRLVDSLGDSSTSTVFLSVACAGCSLDGEGDQSWLQANADSVDVNAGQHAAIAPMRNDQIPDRDTVSFRLDADPVEGMIEARAGGVVVYKAPDNFDGSDTIVYSIRDAIGNQSMASIQINVACPLCGVAGVELSWPANAAEENIAGYRIYFGPDENEHTSTMLREIRVTSRGFDADTPSLTFNPVTDLNLGGRDSGCFRISAIRGGEESAQSSATCFTLG